MLVIWKLRLKCPFIVKRKFKQWWSYILPTSTFKQRWSYILPTSTFKQWWSYILPTSTFKQWWSYILPTSTFKQWWSYILPTSTFKQWWSYILPTKLTTSSHLNSLNTMNETTTYMYVVGLGQAQTCWHYVGCMIFKIYYLCQYILQLL